MLRAKFKVDNIEKFGVLDDDGGLLERSLKLSAVTDDGVNKEWSKWTPSGELTLYVTNPSACEQIDSTMRVGDEYYIDIIPAADYVDMITTPADDDPRPEPISSDPHTDDSADIKPMEPMLWGFRSGYLQALMDQMEEGEARTPHRHEVIEWACDQLKGIERPRPRLDAPADDDL